MKRMQAYQFQRLPKNKHLSHINASLGANRFVWGNEFVSIRAEDAIIMVSRNGMVYKLLEEK